MMFPARAKLKGLYRKEDERQWNYVWLNGKILDPEDSLKIRNHSPDGFNWGYGGSGPAQLALAVCLELYGPLLAGRVYQDFKRYYIASLPEGKDFEVEIDLEQFNREVLGDLKFYRVTLTLFKGEEESEDPLREEPFVIVVPSKSKERAAIEAEQFYWSVVLPGQEIRDTVYDEVASVEEAREKAGGTAYDPDPPAPA